MVLARMTANYQSRMATDELVLKAVDWLRTNYQPKSIWLFGSASRYQLTEYSDLDVAVLFQSESDLKNARSSGIFQISQVVGWPVDLLLMTQMHFEARAKVGGVCEIIKDEGLCLYDSEA